MRSKKSIEEEIDYIESRIEWAEGEDKSHLIGFRNGLEWVLDREEYEEDKIDETQI